MRAGKEGKTVHRKWARGERGGKTRIEDEYGGKEMGAGINRENERTGRQTGRPTER